MLLDESTSIVDPDPVARTGSGCTNRVQFRINNISKTGSLPGTELDMDPYMSVPS